MLRYKKCEEGEGEVERSEGPLSSQYQSRMIVKVGQKIDA